MHLKNSMTKQSVKNTRFSTTVLKYILYIVCAYDNVIPGFTACRSRVLSTSGEFVEALRFRHFARYMSFTPTGKQGKKKQIMNGIEVSVVLHLV